jgi:hypothetical protein
MHATWPAHTNLLVLATLIIFGLQNKKSILRDRKSKSISKQCLVSSCEQKFPKVSNLACKER